MLLQIVRHKNRGEDGGGMRPPPPIPIKLRLDTDLHKQNEEEYGL